MFSWLFSRNPTRLFKRTITPPLIWDTEAGKLNGMTLGMPVETLQPLGPASEYHSSGAGHHHLVYDDLGLTASVVEDKLDNICIEMQQNEGEPQHAADFPAIVRIIPHAITLSAATRQQKVEDVFGPPTERDEDEGEVSLQYRIGQWCCEFDFDAKGQLVIFTVYTP